MKITLIYNTVCAFATQRNATQRNATQRIPQLYLNNNFKFYIFQFFRTLKNLSVFICFAKIFSLIKNSFGKNSLSLRGFAKNRSNLFSVDCFASFHSLAMTIKNKLAILNNNVALAHCVNNSEKGTQGIRRRHPVGKTPCYSGYAFSCALKNKFEIISQLNYGFCYKNYFFNLNQVFRNSYDFGGRFGKNLNYGFEKNCNGGFGKNYFRNCNFGYGFWNEIYSIWHDLKGFLFNRKILKTKI